MTDQQSATVDHKRPIAISVICAIGFIGVFIAVPLILSPQLLSPQTRQIGDWYTPVLIVEAVVGLISLVGLWMMRRWAVFLYTAAAIINQAIFLYKGVWNVLTLVIPGIIIVIMFIYLKRMR